MRDVEGDRKNEKGDEEDMSLWASEIL